jgi:putative membrane protein
MSKPSILAGRIALAACITLLPLAVGAQTDSMSKSAYGSQGQMSKVSASDKKFVKQAAEGGIAEVELGKLATEKASSPEVKKFGQRMVDDHTKAGDQLKEIASSKGIQVPDSAKGEMTKEQLSELSGEQFDKAYMSDMVKDHTQDVADFQRESSSGMDPDVKEFAAKTLLSRTI